MNRNLETHFSQVPYIDKPRSIFDFGHGVKTSGNVADLIPLDWQLVLPGDTWRCTTSKVIRLQTMLTPIYDNLYADFYHFYVPYKLIFNKYREFYGENTSGAWVPQTSYRIPAISSPEGGFDSCTIADYLGLPVGVSWSNQDRNAPSALPFRAYALIASEFFRDENLTDPLNIPISDADQTGTNGSSYINDVANGGKPFKVAKYHDRFTSCLPAPQRGNAVEISSIQAGYIPVGPMNSVHDPIDTLSYNGVEYPIPINWNTKYHDDGSTSVFMQWGASGTPAFTTGSNTYSKVPISTGNNYVGYPVNLYGDASSLASSVTINELRLAFQLQRYYEATARGGNRYIEWLASMFGVHAPNYLVQRPEYLGGNRIPLNIDQVTNQAQSQADFLGDLGAFSHTSDVHEDYEKSFSEPGIVMTLMCVRYDHSYSQGVSRKWTRRDLLDQYIPTFAHISEQPVYAYEVYADGNMDNNTVFGYNEAWSDYRFAESITTGEMRPGIQNTLASWHLGDYYTQTPTLSDSWIREDPSIVDRVLAVSSSNANQFFIDVWFDQKVTRVMPAYSVPGLIDHF